MFSLGVLRFPIKPLVSDPLVADWSVSFKPIRTLHTNFSLNLQDKEPPTFAFFLEEGHQTIATAALEAKKRSKQKDSLIFGADIRGLSILPKEDNPLLQAA